MEHHSLEADVAAVAEAWRRVAATERRVIKLEEELVLLEGCLARSQVDTATRIRELVVLRREGDLPDSLAEERAVNQELREKR